VSGVVLTAESILLGPLGSKGRARNCDPCLSTYLIVLTDFNGSLAMPLGKIRLALAVQSASSAGAFGTLAFNGD